MGKMSHYNPTLRPSRLVYPLHRASRSSCLLLMQNKKATIYGQVGHTIRTRASCLMAPLRTPVKARSSGRDGKTPWKDHGSNRAWAWKTAGETAHPVIHHSGIVLYNFIGYLSENRHISASSRVRSKNTGPPQFETNTESDKMGNGAIQKSNKSFCSRGGVRYIPSFICCSPI